jgi:ethanolaminephosphotransferase
LLANRTLGLGRSWWTVASQIATLANFYLTTWEEYHTGVLFLGYFSGPVEGILMIVVIYFITGFFGASP